MTSQKQLQRFLAVDATRQMRHKMQIPATTPALAPLLDRLIVKKHLETTMSPEDATKLAEMLGLNV